MSSVIVAKTSVILAFKFVISGTGVQNTLSLTYRHKKKSRGVISGDRGGQGVGPSLPIHLFGNVTSKNRRTSEPQYGGAPSCWKIIHGWNSSEVQRKVPTCPDSFLVINVCNQGKNLCSPCIHDQALMIHYKKYDRKYVYRYVNLLYYKKHSLLHVSATYCGIFREVFFEGCNT